MPSVSRVNDLQVVEAAKTCNDDTSVINFATDKLTVQLDGHGKLLACGYPDKALMFIIERRCDFEDIIHMHRQCINSIAMHNVMQILNKMNMVRGWEDGEFSFSQLLEDLGSSKFE